MTRGLALVRGDLGAAEWDEQVARLARMGPEVAPVILDRLRRSALPEAAVYVRLACELAGDRAKPALLEVLCDRTVGDSLKLTILREMEESGLDTVDLPLDQLLSDPQARLGNGRALTGLDELASRAMNRPLRRAAQQAPERLRRRGVRPVERNPAGHAGRLRLTPRPDNPIATALSQHA